MEDTVMDLVDEGECGGVLKLDRTNRVLCIKRFILDTSAKHPQLVPYLMDLFSAYDEGRLGSDIFIPGLWEDVGGYSMVCATLFIINTRLDPPPMANHVDLVTLVRMLCYEEDGGSDVYLQHINRGLSRESESARTCLPIKIRRVETTSSLP
jgi:hypothetical protein